MATNASPIHRLVLEHADERDLTKLSEYEAVGGYRSLRTALELDRDALIEQLLASGLRGRGGAGFPTGRKASFLPKPGDTQKPIYLTVNADESEPGSFKDREIMFANPHSLIEGTFIVSHAIGAETAFIYIRGEYLTEYEILRAALEEALAAGHVGPSVMGSETPVTIVLHRGAGAYICGEETGLLESLEGKRGQPRAKPPFPAISGLYAAPTLINNVETIATVPDIVRMGGETYGKLGVENSAGTRVFSLSGNVVSGGNYELELGTPLRTLIYDLGGGIADGRELKAIIPGGSSVPVLTASEVDTPLDFDSMAKAGTMLGSGAVIVIDDRCCMVQLGLRVAQFYQHESCGKCTPCREGTRWMVQILKKIEYGEASRASSTFCSTSATGSSATASAHSATRPRCRSRVTSRGSARSTSATSTKAAARSAASRRSRACSRQSTTTTRTCAPRSRFRFMSWRRSMSSWSCAGVSGRAWRALHTNRTNSGAIRPATPWPPAMRTWRALHTNRTNSGAIRPATPWPPAMRTWRALHTNRTNSGAIRPATPWPPAVRTWRALHTNRTNSGAIRPATPAASNTVPIAAVNGTLGVPPDRTARKSARFD